MQSYTRTKSKVLAVFLSMLLVFSSFSVSVFAAEEGARLTILHVNDRHGRTGAEAYISQMLKDLQAAGENVLLLDAGDSIHGQTPTNLSKGATMVEVMNAVGYMVMTPGNHEFNFGSDRLLELSESMEFPLLAANVKSDDGTSLFESHRVFEMNGMKVGVFGLATPETVTKSDPRNLVGINFENPAEAAVPVVKALQDEGCDVIVALVHLGLDEATLPNERSEAIAAIDGVDVVIDGHSHTTLENGKMVGDTLIAQTGEFAKNIGVVEVTVNGDTLEKTAKLIAVDEETTLVADVAIAGIIEETLAKIEPITSVVVGNTPFELQGARTAVRTHGTNLGDALTDSMRHATGADISFMTGGNIRETIKAGDITMGDVLTTLPFSNLIMKVELNGADVLKVLEHGVQSFPGEDAKFIHVSGLKVKVDANAPVGSKVKEALLDDGSPVDVNKTYTLATIDFLASGGDGYEMLKNGKNAAFYGGDADAFASYLGSKPTLKAEAEFRVAAVEETASVPDVEVVIEPVVEVSVAPAPEIVPVVEETVVVKASEKGVYIVQKGDYLVKIAEMHDTTWRELQKLNNLPNPNLIMPGQKIVVPAA